MNWLTTIRNRWTAYRARRNEALDEKRTADLEQARAGYHRFRAQTAAREEIHRQQKAARKVP